MEFFAGQEETLLKLAYTKTGNSVNIRLESAEGGRVELNYNETDRSGSVEIYEFDSLVGSYVWLSDGTGMYTNHQTGEAFSWP